MIPLYCHVSHTFGKRDTAVGIVDLFITQINSECVVRVLIRWQRADHPLGNRQPGALCGIVKLTRLYRFNQDTACSIAQSTGSIACLRIENIFINIE